MEIYTQYILSDQIWLTTLRQKRSKVKPEHQAPCQLDTFINTRTCINFTRIQIRQHCTVNSRVKDISKSHSLENEQPSILGGY